MKNFLISFCVIFSTQILSMETFFCQKELESLPILEGGRLKPLYVTAEESIKFLVGKYKKENLTRTQMYCLLSLKQALGKDLLQLRLKVEHVKLSNLLNLHESSTEISYEDLLPKAQDLQFALMKEKNDNSLKKALEKLLNQVHLYQKIADGNHWMLPKKMGNKVEWFSLSTYFSEEDLKGISSHKNLFEKIKSEFISLQGNKYLFELNFLKLNLPVWSLLFTLVAIGAMAIGRFNIVLSFTALAFFSQIALIVCRIIVSGRAPVTNMYETVMFSGFGALVLGLLLGHFLKEKIYVYLALAYNMCTLLMMNFASGLVSASISPLVPVLRDNFWLSTHVTSIVLSYGALALSWILANFTLIKKRFFYLSNKDEIYYSQIIYNCLKFGSTLLFFGIILGGVWADYSWGRFWGWDPKETWSLIVFCIYMAILHGKYTSWLPREKFIPSVALAFLSVMMAWFGVNYILASGLHSYGFSQGGAFFLSSFFIIQILLVVTTTQFKFSKK